MQVCIVRARGKKIFGRLLRYSSFRNSYMVEFRRPVSIQWIPENLVQTRAKGGK